MRIRVGIATAVLCSLPSVAWAGGQDGGVDDYVQAIFDLTGVEYAGGPPAVSGMFDVDPNRQIMRLRWEDVILETNDNTGTPNWANEAYFGILAVDLVGEPLGWVEQPFPDDYSGDGHFGPVDGEVSLELANVFTGPSGTVSVLTGSTFVDGSGLPAGQYLGGRLIIEYMGIPAPGGLALLAAAAWRTRRRRRSS